MHFILQLLNAIHLLLFRTLKLLAAFPLDMCTMIQSLTRVFLDTNRRTVIRQEDVQRLRNGQGRLQIVPVSNVRLA